MIDDTFSLYIWNDRYTSLDGNGEIDIGHHKIYYSALQEFVVLSSFDSQVLYYVTQIPNKPLALAVVYLGRIKSIVLVFPMVLLVSCVCQSGRQGSNCL